ncbi:MAG: LacI family DNA-binding transcriptional regulator [Paracoccaceae bacterium]
MARRPTITDVAAEAGVSPATVDRVLNGRLKVREDTARRVYDAARRLGYHATALIEQRLQPRRPSFRLGVILHKGRQAFYRNFAEALERAVREAPGIDGQLVLEFATSQSPEEVAALLGAMHGRVDAVAATAVNHQAVTAAASDLSRAGIPVFALLSDFAQGIRAGYVGLNNMKVGRNAAWMVATSARAAAKVAIFVGGHRWHGHELRETGFRSYFREYEPQVRLLDPLVNLETRQLTYEATLDLLARHPDLGGIYVAGGGMEGAIAALREVRQPGEVRLVVNELTDDSRAGLVDRYVTMVIATPLDRLCDDLLRLAVAAAADPAAPGSGLHFIDQRVYLSEMV